MSREKKTGQVHSEVRDGQRAEQRATRRRTRGSDSVSPADYGSINPELLAGVIRAVTFTGAAVQFGYTRDGAAYAIRIVGDGPEAYTEYIRPTEDVELYLSGVIEDFVS